MTGVSLQHHPDTTRFSHIGSQADLTLSTRFQPQLGYTPWSASTTTMESQQSYPKACQSSPVASSSARMMDQDMTPSANTSTSTSSTTTGSGTGVGTQFLPRQVFSSPPAENAIYPASTMAAVEATRARFFARQSQSHPGSASRTPRSTHTANHSCSSSASRRTHKAQPFASTSSSSSVASSSSSAYRQSFFERCQRAMNHSRAQQRQQKVLAFRKGADAFTSSNGILSDDIDVDMDEDGTDLDHSSPPAPSLHYNDDDDGGGGGEAGGVREEDDEMTRRKILAEYSRLKRISELKGHLEIGWIHPDHLDWLETEVEQEKRRMESSMQQGEQQMIDPYWQVDDQQLEQLWLDSLSPPHSALPQQGSEWQQQAASMAMPMAMQQGKIEDAFDDDDDDVAFEQALAQLPV